MVGRSNKIVDGRVIALDTHLIRLYRAIAFHHAVEPVHVVILIYWEYHNFGKITDIKLYPNNKTPTLNVRNGVSIQIIATSAEGYLLALSSYFPNASCNKRLIASERDQMWFLSRKSFNRLSSFSSIAKFNLVFWVGIFVP